MKIIEYHPPPRLPLGRSIGRMNVSVNCLVGELSCFRSFQLGSFRDSHVEQKTCRTNSWVCLPVPV